LPKTFWKSVSSYAKKLMGVTSVVVSTTYTAAEPRIAIVPAPSLIERLLAAT
jgi:hypothetical protein